MVSKPTGPVLEINFDRASKYYEPGEKVEGTAFVVGATSLFEHNGFSLLAEAYMDTVSQIRGNSGPQGMPMNDRIYFMKKTEQFPTPGKFNQQDPLKFAFELAATGQLPLIDAYVGVDFSIVYKVTLTIKSKEGKPIDGNTQFYCKVPGSGVDPEKGRKYQPQNFLITPDALTAPPNQKLPKFKFSGQISSVNCCFTEPFEGYLICDEAELQIKSIEIQLLRVETFQGKTNATEVQNIQVADGNVISGLEIPLYMLFPRNYSCPTYQHPDKKFKIEFQVNLIVIFHNGYQLTESFPVRIYR